MRAFTFKTQTKTKVFDSLREARPYIIAYLKRKKYYELLSIKDGRTFGVSFLQNDHCFDELEKYVEACNINNMGIKYFCYGTI